MISLFAKYLNNTPFLRYLLFFATGILLYLFDVSWSIVLTGTVILLFSLSFCFWRFPLLRNTFYLFCGHLSLLLIAFFICLLKNPSDDPKFILNQKSPLYYKVVLTDKVSDHRYYGSIISSYSNGKPRESRGNILLTFKNDDPQVLDTLQIMGCPQFVKEPLNPEEFNYKQYLRGKGIFIQDYVLTSRIVHHGKHYGFSLKKFCYNFRLYFAKRIRLYIINPDIASIAEALILGIKSEINDELLNAYIKTGTVHVLAVSGMHIGLLFGSIVWICAYLFGKNHVLAYSLLALSIMWFFAMITGFSASVVRAAVMYTVYQMGLMTGKKINLPNTLFSSCFLILLLEPMMLIDIGFQLSFFAVLGIISLQPFFQSIFDTQNNLLKNVRDLFTVSISAQLGVLPISLYYFKQFPNLFIISNLFEVTLSTLALYTGLLCIIFVSFDGILAFLCKILSYLVGLMNAIATFLSDLSFSVSKVYLSFEETLILGFLTLFLILFLRTKKISFLKFNLLFVVIFVICIGFRYYSVFISEKVIFYAHKKQAVIDVYENGKLRRLYCTSDTAHDARFGSILESNRLRNSLSENPQRICLGSYSSVVFQKKSKRIQIINGAKDYIASDIDIVYLNSQILSKPLPQSSLIIVRNKKLRERLLNEGYSQIHCLETDGALVL